MNRLVIILLSVCAGVVCALLAYIGFLATHSAGSVAKDSPTIECNSLLESVPTDLKELSLTKFKAGNQYVSYDDDNDGQWDRVFVPLFPSHFERLDSNYRAVIVSLADVTNETQLFEKIRQPELTAEYWYWSQKLDNRTYNRLAENYLSLDFGNSVILYSGHSPTSGYGTAFLWVGCLGALLSMIVIGWNLVGLVIAGIRRESETDAGNSDTDVDVISNRAQLPTN